MIDVSIIIVNHNARILLSETITSLFQSTNSLSFETILVDNASTDGSVSAIKRRFPEVTVLENPENFGFAKANNKAIRMSQGRYILLLNPDTVVQPGAIETIVNFMDFHPDIGICGPKIVLPDGKLDAPCRRSCKTPAIYLYKTLGLSKLFPNSKRFGKYYLSYLNEDAINEVDAVIGAFLMIRRETVEQIGLLDERFFMYCEDEDWCFRAKKEGWKVYYNPQAQIIHYKGSSTKKRKVWMIFEWHKAIYLFHKKNLAKSYPLIVNWFVYSGIGLKLIFSLITNVFKAFLQGRLQKLGEA